MPEHKLTPREARSLQEALDSDYKTVAIRLREGEYQYALAKAIASFQLDLCFPDAKDIIQRLYGKEKTENIQFRRRIQTILKKMERNNVVRILPKKEPWELQRYALSSFKFKDVDKNHIAFVTDRQAKKVQNLLNNLLSPEKPTARQKVNIAKIGVLVFVVVACYTTILWDLIHSPLNPVVYIPVFSVAIACSLILGKTLARR